jgi:NADH:ubiquinone oxidoreductase subunit E/NAD-dependent dihydropyrimidine dehydrogenase PreA subunit
MIASDGPPAKALTKENDATPCGSVLVCGAGIAGIQAALDLSAAGFHVYLVEQSPTIGGTMAKLDKTFPTGDCATCTISPKLVACMRDLNIDVLTMADVARLDGEAGHFKAQVSVRPRSVDADKCTGCGDCVEACPVRNVPQAVEPFHPAMPADAAQSAVLRDSLARHGTDKAALIPILQDINEACGYLPREALEALAGRLGVPLAEVLRVTSFYNAFSLEPVGRHIIEVCLGTACFVRGSGMLLERLAGQIGVAPEGGTDKDRRFTLRTVRCIGCCALAPAMRIDGVTFGKMKLDKVGDILERFQ